MFRFTAAALALQCVYARESRHEGPVMPCGWRESSTVVAEDTTLTLFFTLRQQRLDELRRIAHAVSDPHDAEYGQHRTKEEVDELTMPRGEHVEAVETWLRAHGVAVRRMASGAVVEATLTTGMAQSMLDTTFHEHVHDTTGQRKVRAGSYVLPEAVLNATSSVYGLHGLPLPPRRSLRKHAQADVAVTPEVIRETYGVSSSEGSGNEANRQAVAEFTPHQEILLSDLDQFFEDYVPGSPVADRSVHAFFGDDGTGNETGDEAALDVQYIMGSSPGILTDFYYNQTNDFCADMMRWSCEILNDENPALVQSVSYGYQGNISDIGCNGDYQVQDVDLNLAKMAARGITVIFSSGDSGAGYVPNCNTDQILDGVAVTNGTVLKRFDYSGWSVNLCCEESSQGVAWTFDPADGCTIYSHVTSTGELATSSSGGPALFTNNAPPLFPSWPASSIWVTSVGATRFQDQKPGQLEVAADDFGSGGGFSDMFEAFKDQQAAIREYMQRAPGLPATGTFAPAGRGTPDVAALGEGYQVILAGELESVGGTSASTPAFAAMVSLLNEERLARGMPSMGYLNPWLYQNPDMFNDVTVGTNDVLGGGAGPILYGYNCTNGWDPVTGLGTPNFTKMLDSAVGSGITTNEIIV